jgi:hypothetical protein
VGVVVVAITVAPLVVAMVGWVGSADVVEVVGVGILVVVAAVGGVEIRIPLPMRRQDLRILDLTKWDWKYSAIECSRTHEGGEVCFDAGSCLQPKG